MLWTHEHDELRRTAKKIVDTHINPFIDEWEEAHKYPAHQVMKILGDAGLLGISKPEKYGGLGLDHSYEIVAAEEMGHIQANGVSSSVGVQMNMCTPSLAKYGSEELCKEWLVPTIAGDIVGAIGVSEEGSGSDVSSVKTYAKRDGDDYVINGSKMWTTNGIQSDWICLLANTSQDNGPHRNKSLIVLPTNLPGVTRTELKKLGMHSSDTAQIFLDDVRVPVSNRIGEENRGFIYQMEQFQQERLYVVARSLGVLDDCIDITMDYTSRREAFGKSILDHQWVSYHLAEMKTEVMATRALLHQAVEHYVAGEDVTQLASMAKYKVGKLSESIPGDCLRFWGGQGYMHENRISRIFRDTKLASIGGGANEVMLQIIAKQMRKAM